MAKGINSLYPTQVEANQLFEEVSNFKLHKYIGITLIVIGIITLLAVVGIGGLGLLQSNQVISLSQSWFTNMVDSISKGRLWGLIGAGVIASGSLIGVGAYLVYEAKQEMFDRLQALDRFLGSDLFPRVVDCSHTFMNIPRVGLGKLHDELPKKSYQITWDQSNLCYTVAFKSEDGILRWNKNSYYAYPKQIVNTLDVTGYTEANILDATYPKA